MTLLFRKQNGQKDTLSKVLTDFKIACMHDYQPDDSVVAQGWERTAVDLEHKFPGEITNVNALTQFMAAQGYDPTPMESK